MIEASLGLIGHGGSPAKGLAQSIWPEGQGRGAIQKIKKTVIL
jgi:hypothetical protein